jgi:hypothetical protein
MNFVRGERGGDNMRIIRVSGCHECPYSGYMQNAKNPLIGVTYCLFPNLKYELIVTEYEDSKTLPEDKCPLEKEDEEDDILTNYNENVKAYCKEKRRGIKP